MAGYYTEITDISIVSSAPAGAHVFVDGCVTNTWTGIVLVNAAGWYNDAQLNLWRDGGYELTPGSKWSFVDVFTMPDHDVVISLASYYWDGTEWVQDDVQHYTVVLEGAETGLLLGELMPMMLTMMIVVMMMKMMGGMMSGVGEPAK